MRFFEMRTIVNQICSRRCEPLTWSIRGRVAKFTWEVNDEPFIVFCKSIGNMVVTYRHNGIYAEIYSGPFDANKIFELMRECRAPASPQQWTDEKNERRWFLIDKEIAGSILPDEKRELDRLQDQMLVYRREMAPLPDDQLESVEEIRFAPTLQWTDYVYVD